MRCEVYIVLTCIVSFVSSLSCSREDNLVIDQSMTRKTKIIAHRGFWNAEGAYENSISSARAAIAIGADEIELDVWITADDSVIVNHDETYHGLDILSSSYSELVSYLLPNGEKLPTIRDFLLLLKDYPNEELFIEIKANRAVDRLVEILREESFSNPVKFISYSRIACDHLISLDPSFHIEPLHPLGEDMSPSRLFDCGYSGIAYNSNYYHENSSVIYEVKNLGMTLSSWIVNTQDEYDWCLRNGFEYAITNYPNTLVDLTKLNLFYWQK